MKHQRTITALGLAGLLGLTLAAQAQDGQWQCVQGSWFAYTTERQMQGQTAFECGGGCGDDSHNQPYSWVDITGGISQSQENTSDSFFGPNAGEWNGCASPGLSQVSTGAKGIAGINQSWDRWPASWGGYYHPFYLPSLDGSSRNMNTPYASVYDLDCAPGWVSWTWGGSCPKEVIGTIVWNNFPVYARLAAGSTDVNYGYARYNLEGDTGTYCSTPANSCESVVCSDLHVRNTLECYWQPYDPCADIPEHMEIPSECI